MVQYFLVVFCPRRNLEVVMSIKRLIFHIVGWISIFLFCLGILFFYTISNGFRDYKSFCSNYIEPLEQYHQKNGTYPPSLENFETSSYDFRYNYEKCGYEREKDSFSFFFSDGFIGVIGYSSKNSKWWYD